MELAMTEIKISFALTIRRFDILDAYEGFDKARKNLKGMAANGQRTYVQRRWRRTPSGRVSLQGNFAPLVIVNT